MGSRIDDLAANTPETRDRTVDFLRGVSILAVVVGHWTIGIIFWRDGVIQDSTLRWWLERPVWIAVPGAILAGIVAVVGRFERPRPRVPTHPS